MSRFAELHHHRPRVSAVSIGKDYGSWVPFLLLLLATSFNFFLCFVNTNVADISALYVILSELVIILLALFVSLRVLDVHSLVLIGIFFLYLIGLVLVRAYLAPGSEIDVKVVRDFLIPLVFFCWDYAFQI